MTYTFDENHLGYLQIANTDAGYTTANGTANAIPTPPATLGCVARAFDPTYGEGEFIMLLGVANTIVGSCVIWNTTTYQTTLCPTTKNTARPVAFAMSANGASSFGWYQIGGTAIAAKGTARLQPNVTVAVTTTGLVGNTNSGIEIQGAKVSSSTTALTAATTVALVIDRPHMQGRIT